MEFKLRCNFCNETSSLTADKLKEVHKNNLILTVFTCEKCGKSRVVQIDSDETLEILRAYKQLYKKALKTQICNKKVHQKTRVKAHKLKLELDSKRNLLNTRFSSLFTEYEDNKEQSELCESATI